MPHGWASLSVKMPRGWASEKGANDQPVEQENNNRSQINVFFYRICYSSNIFLTAKNATFSRTVHVLLSVISRSQVETISGVKPYATFKGRRTELFLTMPHPRADLLGKCRRGEGEVKKCPTNAWGGGEMSGLGSDQALTLNCDNRTEVFYNPNR